MNELEQRVAALEAGRAWLDPQALDDAEADLGRGQNGSRAGSGLSSLGFVAWRHPPDLSKLKLDS